MKPLNILLLALAVCAQYALWFGDKNVFDLRQLRHTTEQMRLGNERLQQRNDELLAQVIDLKEGGETLETLARSELGLIREGETFFQVIE